MQGNKTNFLTHQQRVKFTSAVIPLINVFIIPAIAFTANNKLLCIALCLLNPIIGVTSFKLGIKLGKEKLFILIPFLLTATNLFLLCWAAGSKSPSFLMGISFIGVWILLFTQMRHIIVVVLTALLLIASGSYLAGKTLPDISVYLTLLICYSFVLVRLLQFTLLQGREIENQKQLIEEKNNDITASINYAKRIQQAQLPTEKYITKSLSKLKEK